MAPCAGMRPVVQPRSPHRDSRNRFSLRHQRTRAAMTSYRLNAPAGARLDRTQAVTFRFNGRSFDGFRGDTLASALLANGVRLIGRSYKLHRPRGILSCGIEEPTGIVDVGEGARRTPNQRATLVEIYEGLVAASVNCWPSVEFDVGALNDWFHSLLPAGF